MKSLFLDRMVTQQSVQRATHESSLLASILIGVKTINVTGSKIPRSSLSHGHAQVRSDMLELSRVARITT